MNDNIELKRLAEAAPEGPWFGPEYAPGTSYVFDVDLGTLLHYESIDTEQDACLRYVAAANPAAVLALIAQIERDEMHLRAFSSVAETAIAERDQLKAENEALRKYGEEFAVLAERRREEVETLRKERDARHPFKPFHEPAIGFTGCVICGVYTDHSGLPCPKTRATADAAMGKGEQS